jgi:hypothetical protein
MTRPVELLADCAATLQRPCTLIDSFEFVAPEGAVTLIVYAPDPNVVVDDLRQHQLRWAVATEYGGHMGGIAAIRMEAIS